MNKSTDKKSSSSEIEFAFEEVPDSARKSLGSILVILTGYTLSLSNFVTGATVGFKMPFQQAILACGLGNLMLIVVATLLGIISCRTGLTTSVGTVRDPRCQRPGNCKLARRALRHCPYHRLRDRHRHQGRLFERLCLHAAL